MKNPQAVTNIKTKPAKCTTSVSSEKSTTKRQTTKSCRAKVLSKKSTEIVPTSSKQENVNTTNSIKNEDKIEKVVLSDHCIENKVNERKNNEKTKEVTECFKDLNVDDSFDDKEKKKTDNNQKPKEINSPSSGQLSKPIVFSAEKKTKRRIRSKKTEIKNHTITEYYPIRRSERKYKSNAINEIQKDLENRIINQIEDGLQVKVFEEKGRGIVTTRDFFKGEFVVEYIGELIDGATAKQREIKYSRSKKYGCYMYYFKYKDQKYCIDATAESGKLGRLINHSKKGNLVSKIIEVHQLPHIILFAKTDIPSGTEILYDYGDRNQESLQNHPWLKS